MGQLHEVLAVIPERKRAAQTAAEVVKRRFGEDHRYRGVEKTYRPMREDGEKLPDQREEMAATVGSDIAEFIAAAGPLIDAGYQVDVTNTTAKAGIHCDGLSIENIPGTALLQLDKRLAELREIIAAAPVIESKVAWTASDIGPGVRVSLPVEQYRTAKVPKSQVVVPATDHHPAQVNTWAEDVQVGTFTTRIWSGAISNAEKSGMLGRLDKLREAVKTALAAANAATHATEKIAAGIFKYVLGDLPLGN